MSREQLFALDLGLAAVCACGLVAYIDFRVRVVLYLIKSLEDHDHREKATALLDTGRRVSDPIFLGLNGSILIAIFAFPQKLERLIEEAPWIAGVAVALPIIGIAAQYILDRIARNRLEHARKEEKEAGAKHQSTKGGGSEDGP